MNQKYCNGCGASLPENVEFCPYCGSRLEVHSGYDQRQEFSYQEPGAQPPVQSARQKNRRLAARKQLPLMPGLRILGQDRLIRGRRPMVKCLRKPLRLIMDKTACLRIFHRSSSIIRRLRYRSGQKVRRLSYLGFWALSFPFCFQLSRTPVRLSA